jgi:hypothetical protein
METSLAEDIAVLNAVAVVSGPQGHWADVMSAIRSATAPENVGPWRQKAKSLGWIVQHETMMNIARITDEGYRALKEQA